MPLLSPVVPLLNGRIVLVSVSVMFLGACTAHLNLGRPTKEVRLKPKTWCAEQKVKLDCGSPSAKDTPTWNACIEKAEAACKDEEEQATKQEARARPTTTAFASVPTSVPPKPSPKVESDGSPSQKDVAAAILASVRKANDTCGKPSRRSLLTVRTDIKVDGSQKVELEASTLPKRESVACVVKEVTSLSFPPYKMPNGAGKGTDCPLGSEGAAMFSCKQVQRDYLTYSVAMVLEPSGDVVELANVDAAPLQLDGYSLGAVDMVFWPKGQYCVETKPVGQGVCFAIDCNKDSSLAGDANGPSGVGNRTTVPVVSGGICDSRPSVPMTKIPLARFR